MSAGVTKTVIWIVTLVLVFVFFFGGYGKFRDPASAQHFALLGWPAWFRMTVGAVELTCGAFLLLPWLAPFAAIPLAATSAAAAISYVLHPPWGLLMLWPITFIAGLAFVARYRWKERTGALPS